MKSDRRKSSRKVAFRRKLIYAAVASCFVITPAYANPIGATVVSGQAGFDVQGNTLTITNTPNAILNWQQFSIGPGEITRFMQQSASSAVLNRVLGQDPSQILGSLLSNGRVFLVNPNGILFGQGAVIDVAGLVASTLRLSDGDFLAGRLNFTNGVGAGGIDNQGAITAPNGGNIYLIAPDIKNSGLITSPQGEILLAAGHTVNLMDTANPDVQVMLSAPDTQAVNIGTLMAQSGKIGIYGALIGQQGTANADTAVVGANGRIMLRAGRDITLEPGSVITASGLAGGVRDGGEIRIIADGTLNMRQGSEVHVDGGADGGNGGFLELSGKQAISLRGAYTGRARANGYKGGKLLLDPLDIILCNSSAACGATDIIINTLGSGGIGSSGVVAAGDSPATLYLHTNMAGSGWTDVQLAATHDISVNSALITTDVPGGGSLTMNAGNNINVAAAIGSSGSRFNHDLTLQAGNNVNINANIYMGSQTLLVRSGAASGDLGFAPYASCGGCERSIFITPTAANPVTVDVLGGIELYAPASGAVNITGGSNAWNQDKSVTVHGGTVTVNAGSVLIQGGSANASVDSSPTSADASASVSADGAMSIATTSGGLTIRGGGATADASSSGVNVTATANATISVTGNLEITDGAGGRVASVQISGGYAWAEAYGTSGSGNAEAYANATVTAGSLTLRADSLEARGGNTAHAEVGSWSGGVIDRSATAESKALLQVNGNVAAMDIGSGGLLVEALCNCGTALIYGAGGENTATADRRALINVTGNITSLAVTGGGITVQGGNARAEAYGSGSNSATENASAAITAGGSLTITNATGLTVQGGSDASASASGNGNNTATATANATIEAGSIAMTIAGAVLVQGGSGASASASSGSALAHNTALVQANARLAASGSLTITNATSLTVQGGDYAYASASDSGSNIATATANATIEAGSIAMTIAGAVLVRGGNYVSASASSGNSLAHNTATATANARMHAVGNLDLTVNGGNVTVAGGNYAAASASEASGMAQATANADAELSADGNLGITVTGGNLTVQGGNYVSASASASSSSAQLTATASANAKIAAVGNVTLDVSGDMLVRGGNYASASASGSGADNVDAATASANASITAGSILTITDAASLTVQGGNYASASASDSGSNTATATANATVEAGSIAMTIAGPVLVRGGNYASADASWGSALAHNTALAQASAKLAASGSLTITNAASLTVQGGDYAYASASDTGNNTATATADATVQAGSLSIALSGALSIQGGDASALVSGSGINTATATANALITVTGAQTLNIVGDVNLTGGSATATGSGATAKAIALLDPAALTATIGGNVTLTGGYGGNYGPGALAFAGIFNTGPISLTIGGATGLTLTGGGGGPTTYGSWVVPGTGYDSASAITISYTGGGGMIVNDDPLLDAAFIMSQALLVTGLDSLVTTALDFGAGEANDAAAPPGLVETIYLGNEEEDEENDKPVCK